MQDARTRRLSIEVGTAQIELHGDDAYFADAHFQCVSDGVGGTKAPSAPFAKRLVLEIQTLLTAAIAKHGELTVSQFKQFVMAGVASAKLAFFTAPQRLAATLTVAYMDLSKGRLVVLSLGDSKTMVIRNQKVAFESQSLVYEFNAPVTICSMLDAFPVERHALVCTFGLQAGDTVITCSDGLTDNLMQNEVTELLHGFKQFGPDVIASELVNRSAIRAKVPRGSKSPFAIAAALEYRRRVSVEAPHVHLVPIKEDLLGETTFGSHDVVIKRSKPHYTLRQLASFANYPAGKTDDITVAVATIAA